MIFGLGGTVSVTGGRYEASAKRTSAFAACHNLQHACSFESHSAKRAMTDLKPCAIKLIAARVVKVYELLRVSSQHLRIDHACFSFAPSNNETASDALGLHNSG